MTIRVAVLSVVAGLSLTAGAARAAECPVTYAGLPYATGMGKGNPSADSAGVRRLGAERAAFMGALANLKACLGDKAKDVTGWSIVEVRYFDSDPLVEIDVAASSKAQQITVIGSGLPTAKKDANVADARVSATRAALSTARRNAQEALDAVFPSAGAPGNVKKTLKGTLNGCATGKTTYWDDQAVTVEITCSKTATAGGTPKPANQPVIQQHAK